MVEVWEALTTIKNNKTVQGKLPKGKRSNKITNPPSASSLKHNKYFEY